MLRSTTYVQYCVVLLMMWQYFTVSDTCPANCTCLPYHYVACTDQSFSTIPDNVPTDTKTLRLAYNEIVELDLPKLYNLDRLRVLDVTSNEIVTILGSFEHFPFLREVYLGQNNLTTISQETFGDTFQKLAYIDLTGNPFNCQCASLRECPEHLKTHTCDILWLKRQIHQNIDRVGRDVLCQSPNDVQGQFIDNVNISEPKCVPVVNHGGNNNHPSIYSDVSYLILAAFGIAIVLGLLLSVFWKRNWAQTRKHSGEQSGNVNLSYTPDDDTPERRNSLHHVDQEMKYDGVEQSTEDNPATLDTESEQPHGNEIQVTMLDGIQSCSAPSSHVDIPTSPEVTDLTVPIGAMYSSNAAVELVTEDSNENLTKTEENSSMVPDSNEAEIIQRTSYRYRSVSFTTGD